MKFKGIIFDLDGTLVDSLEDISDAMNIVLKGINHPTHTYEEYQYFIGSGLRNLVTKALPTPDANENQIDLCYDLMIEVYSKACTNKTKPYDGIIELLDYLKAQNIKLSVFSNKSDDLTKEITATIFPNYFESSVGLTTEPLKKPNPIKALEIAEKMGFKPEEILFIGDSDIDMETATNAKMNAVGVLWGYRSKEDLLSSGAKYILEKPSDLIAIL
jgi:phosphoglycolate phosphatase